MLFSMKESTIPKGVKFSFFMMTFPLLCTTTYLGMLIPAMSMGQIDPANFAFVARTCVRLLALNISFIGGIHYGLAAATYDTAVTEDEIRAIKYQMVYSFIPAAMSFSSASLLLFSTPLTIPTTVIAFTSLMLTQLVTLQVDLKCAEKGLAPQWFLKFRSVGFTIYMLLTTAIFLIYYSKIDYVQRRNDQNRITNLKTALELEDLDFINMVNDLNIDYDETDLQALEKEIQSKVQRLDMKNESISGLKSVA
eukprot:403366214